MKYKSTGIPQKIALRIQQERYAFDSDYLYYDSANPVRQETIKKTVRLSPNVIRLKGRVVKP
jgi:hypothetical protein